MKKILLIIALGFSSILLFNVNADAQSDKPYTDGPVWNVYFIRTKAGMSETYLRDLSTHWVKIVKEAKAEGIIMDYKVLQSRPGSPSDWDLMLLVEIKNYAVLDSIGEKMDALSEKLLGSEDTQHKTALSRNDMRDNIGDKLAQELIFK